MKVSVVLLCLTLLGSIAFNPKIAMADEINRPEYQEMKSLGEQIRQARIAERRAREELEERIKQQRAAERKEREELEERIKQQRINAERGGREELHRIEESIRIKERRIAELRESIQKQHH